MSKNNAKTLEECTTKIASNESEEKEEIRKKTSLKDANEALRDSLHEISQKSFGVHKDANRVRAENEAKLAFIENFKAISNSELARLRETFNKKKEKLENILKKTLEKQINIEEMMNDKRNLQRFRDLLGNTFSLKAF